MESYQRQFIEFALQQKALLFGEFVLKSKRISPYFFNSGCFNTGAAIAKLGRFYADAIVHVGIAYDMIFGPAYKGIPLVTAVAIALAEHYRRDVPYAFNRKEEKDHGEGKLIVGAALAGKVLAIDDVITAGTTVHESVHIIRAAGAEWAGEVICFDRAERGQEGNTSAVESVVQRYGAPVVSIVGLQHVMAYLREKSEMRLLQQMEEYQRQYGAVEVG